MRFLAYSLLLCLALIYRSARAAEPKLSPAWQPWSEAVFQRAQQEKKLVLLDLGTSWCHWCHVMDEQTYADAKVVELLNKNFIVLRADADARPDLANRYEDYGWPATIIFKWDGTELAKRRGYIPPGAMASMLEAFVEDPTPGPSIQPEAGVTLSTASTLSPDQRKIMRERLIAAYDHDHGGWGDGQHFLDWNALEYCLTAGAEGDQTLAGMAQQTLTAGRELIDPVWGGVYQYSTDGDWSHPHFEKIMPFQAENMRVFALASMLRQEPIWLGSAERIHAFLQRFLISPGGAFYTSQDADVVAGEHSAAYFALNDAGRRQHGVPRVDRHLYARENGLAIVGLCALYAAGGDETCLAEARRAAEWVIVHRSLSSGGFRHDEADVAGPYLADSLAMARAFLALYTVTAERVWLQRAEEAARFMDAQFKAKVGFATSVTAAGSLFPAQPQLDENIMLVRFASLLAQHTGDVSFRSIAEHAMTYLSAPSLIEKLGYGTSGVLLADLAISADAPHMTVIGRRGDEAAQALFSTALRHLPTTACLEWIDPTEPPNKRTDIVFPSLDRAAAFVCSDGTCSTPIFDQSKLAEHLQKMSSNRAKP